VNLLKPSEVCIFLHGIRLIRLKSLYWPRALREVAFTMTIHFLSSFISSMIKNVFIFVCNCRDTPEITAESATVAVTYVVTMALSQDKYNLSSVSAETIQSIFFLNRVRLIGLKLLYWPGVISENGIDSDNACFCLRSVSVLQKI